MEPFYIKATETTPEINFDFSNNVFSIKGKSMFLHVDEFYNPIIDWLKNLDGKISHPITVVFDLEYFNIISSKRILFVLYTLNELRNNGSDIEVSWTFSIEDDDMKEVGEDYACMVNLPFNFICKSLEHESF